MCRLRRGLSLCAWILLAGVLQSAASKDEMTATAVLMHNRIAGVPPSAETLAAMVELLAKNKPRQAAMLATENPAFYNLKLRSLFSTWSNVAGNPNVVLNDMIATLIGIVRDDIPFKEALYGDHLYTARDDLIVEPKSHLDKEGQPISRNEQYGWCKDGVLPSYRGDSNEHYHCLDGHDLQSALQRRRQSDTKRGQWFRIEGDDRATGGQIRWSIVPEGAMPTAAIAGILSTRGFASAYYSAGTNRRATAFVLKYFLCHDMERLHDITVQDGFIRPDVHREPGGDHQLFKRRCIGCHAGLDAISGWNVFYDFDDDQVKFTDRGRYLGEQLIYRHGLVRKKITRNIVYAGGYDYRKEENATDAFRNLWTTGQNRALGWRGKTSGSGAREWGIMISASQAFSTCVATHVQRQVCSIADGEENAELTSALANYFEQGQYNMRKLFAATAVTCLTRKGGG